MEGTHPVNLNTTTRRVAAALSGATLLLALSACGDDSGKKLDNWAKGVCDQAQAQVKKIDAANTAISKVNSGGAPQDVKTADSAAFQSISDAYKSLAQIFSSAGPAPKGDEGKTFQQNAVSAFTSLSTQYAGLKKQVDDLDTSNQAKFADGLKGVSGSLQQTTSNGEKSLATLRQGDAGKALAKQPGCQRVSGNASPTASAGSS